MIQRIQSIFLFLASLAFGGQFATDFATSSAAIPSLMADKIYEIQDNPLLLGITALGILIPLVAIFLYNNRPLQSKLAIVTLILGIFLPAVAFLLIYNERTAMPTGVAIEDGIGAYIPLISIISAYLASKYISKDEKLVRSSDRLR
jgi:Mn2+/Fe2+ NRAMP family transporter